MYIYRLGFLRYIFVFSCLQLKYDFNLKYDYHTCALRVICNPNPDQDLNFHQYSDSKPNVRSSCRLTSEKLQI